MKCPICQRDLLDITVGERSVGWDCPTQNEILYPMSAFGKRHSLPVQAIPHYMVRGSRADINLFPFRVETWRTPDEYPGISNLFHFSLEEGWCHFGSCPNFPISSEEKMISRLKLLLVFS